VTSTEDELQRAAYTLNTIAIKYHLKISVNKTKAVAVKGKMSVRTNTVRNNNIIEQVNGFNYLRYTITLSNKRGLEIKINKFNQICSTIRRRLNNNRRKETQTIFYKAAAVLTLTYGSEYGL
jgi:hypothetical protein